MVLCTLRGYICVCVCALGERREKVQAFSQREKPEGRWLLDWVMDQFISLRWMRAFFLSFSLSQTVFISLPQARVESVIYAQRGRRHISFTRRNIIPRHFFGFGRISLLRAACSCIYVHEESANFAREESCIFFSCVSRRAAWQRCGIYSLPLSVLWQPRHFIHNFFLTILFGVYIYASCLVNMLVSRACDFTFANEYVCWLMNE